MNSSQSRNDLVDCPSCLGTGFIHRVMCQRCAGIGILQVIVKPEGAFGIQLSDFLVKA